MLVELLMNRFVFFMMCWMTDVLLFGSCPSLQALGFSATEDSYAACIAMLELDNDRFSFFK